MQRLKTDFDGRQSAVEARLTALAKSFGERLAATRREFAAELSGVLAGTALLEADAVARVVDAELKRIDALAGGAFAGDAFGAIPLRNSVMRQVTACQFGTLDRFEAEKRIVFAQAVIRGWLVRKRFKNLRHRQKKRENIAKELLATEKSYADGLRIMVECFHTPLSALVGTPKEVVTAGDLKLLFSNCQLLYNFHRQLLAQLTERLRDYNAGATRIGDVFVEMAPFFKLYQEYVNNYDLAQKHLVELKSKNARFADALADIEKSPASAGKDLLSYLITPVQRVPRYQMMLAELAKETADDHVDAAALKTALGGIKAAAHSINEAKRKAESAQRMTALAQQIIGIPPTCAFRLLQPHRQFVAEGVLKIKEDARLKEILLFVFNDVLIVGRPKSKLSITNVANAIANNEFRYTDFVQCKKIIPLDRCEVALSDRKDVVRSLDIRHGARLHKLLRCFADEPKTVEAWHERLQALTAARAELLAKSTLRSRADFDEVDEYDADEDATAAAAMARSDSQPLAASAPAPLPAEPGEAVYVQRGKLRDVIRLYDEALKLQESLFALPINLKTLWPKYEQSIQPDLLALLAGRVQKLSRTLAELDERHDRVVVLLKHERLAVQLQQTLAAGVTPLGAIKQSVNGQLEPPVALALLNWYLSVCRIWQDIADLPIVPAQQL